jgi:hypothetical protein
VFVPAAILLNFGLSHTINGLSRQQNLALVIYTNLLLLPTLLKILMNELVFREDQLICLLGIYIYVCIVCMYAPTKSIEKELVLYNERERRGKVIERERKRGRGGGRAGGRGNHVVWMTCSSEDKRQAIIG